MEIGPSGTSAEDSMEIAGTLKKTHKKFNKEDDLIRELSNSPPRIPHRLDSCV